MWSRMNAQERRKVLHRSRFLLWLADFGEPVRMNCMCTSVTLLGPPSEGEDGGPVSGNVQCGLNLTKLRITVNTPESIMYQVAQEVGTGTLRNMTA